MSLDEVWRNSIGCSLDPAQVLAPTFAPLANLPLMSDALANYGLYVTQPGNLSRLDDDGMPTMQENVDDGILLRVQAKWRENKPAITAGALVCTRRSKAGIFARLKTMIGPKPALPSTPPELLRLDRPSADVEALLKLIGDDPTLTHAVLEDARQNLPKRGRYNQVPSEITDIWNLTIKGTDHRDAIRRIFGMLNYGINHNDLQKHANTFLLTAQDAVLTGNWKFLNGMLQCKGEAQFYAAALLADYERKALGQVTQQTQERLLAPYKGSRDGERPDPSIIGDYLEHTVLAPVVRETAPHISSSYKWAGNTGHHARNILQKYGNFNPFVFTIEGEEYGIKKFKSNQGWQFDTCYLEIPSARRFASIGAQRKDLARKAEPTAARLLQYSKGWWQPELVIAQLRPDLVQPADHGLIPAPSLQQAFISAPTRPSATEQAIKLPGGKIGCIEL